MAGEGAEVPKSPSPPWRGLDMSAAGEGRPLLVFLNEVAGGRKLLQAVRERAEDGLASSPSPRRRTSPRSAS